MFFHHKKLMYTVRVRESNPQLASLMLEQFGGPQGELAAAMRYFTQGLGECDPGRKDLLMDIATEEISHLEIIGTIIAMLNRGPKAIQSEGLAEAEDMRLLGQNSTSHTEQILYGGGRHWSIPAGCRGQRPTSTRSGNLPPICARTSLRKRAPSWCMSA